MGEDKGCAHCKGGIGLEYPLYEDDKFYIVCDAHPLIEGHILIIPKEHISCMGALDNGDFKQYRALYERVLNFIQEKYGGAGIFEHGITGQTVFHAHTHFLPFDKSIEEIVPEENSVRPIPDLDELKTEFLNKGRYLFVALNDEKWLVDTKIGYPRFFRDRFANLLNATERGNWKETRDNAKLMETFAAEIQNLKNNWAEFFNREK